MHTMHKTCTALDKQDPTDKITDILLQKQLEQIEKAQKSFTKEITAQQNVTKRRFDDKIMRTENGYAKLWEGRNMANIWFALNHDMNCSNNPTGSRGGCKSSQKRPKSLLIRGKTELGTSSTSGSKKAKEISVPKTTGSLTLLERRATLQSNDGRHKSKFQRNVTFVNSKMTPSDLGDNLKVATSRPCQNGLKIIGENPGKIGSCLTSYSRAGKLRKQKCHLQSHCWGSKFFSNKHSPRRNNELRRYSKIRSPTKNFLGGIDVSHCFTKLSFDKKYSDNYESKIKDFCDSLKHLILTSTPKTD